MSSLRLGGLSVRFTGRAIAASVVTLAAVLAVLCIALSFGEAPITPLDVLRTLLGGGTGGEQFIVLTLRLPRALTAILAGAALGASGAIFQSLTKNPLGSPDIIGFTTGASVGAVSAIVFGAGQAGIVPGALIGGFATSLAVYLLAYRRGVHGFRLVLVGIGVGAFLESVVAYLLLKTSVQQARQATIWLVGSVNGSGWESVVPIAIALAVLLPIAGALTGRMRMLEMGDDTAQALGVRVERSRLALLLVGTALCAVAVAVAGPVAFVALAAPQIMRRLTGAPLGALSSAAMGALVLLAGDVAAQRAFPGANFPVGLATLCIGGIYLIWLLWRENRAGRM